MSDKERIGVSYSKAHTFYLDLNFDVFRGCQYSCEGCHVNKTGHNGFTDHDYDNLKRLLDTAQDSNYQPLIAIVGPTDVFSANTAEEVLGNPRTVDLLRRFEKISFISTFLAHTEQTERVVQLLNNQYAPTGVGIEVNVGFEMRHLHNEGYIQHVKDNRQKVLDLLRFSSVASFASFNVFDYSRTKFGDFLRDYSNLHQMIEEVYGTDIDFNFSLGRKDGLTQAEFTDAADQIKEIFNHNIREDTVEHVRFSLGKLTDSLVERQYNFSNGELYYSPMFYERYVSYNPYFKIPLSEWTIDEIEKYEDNVTTTQYNNVLGKECGSCRYLGSCVNRGILHLMDQHDLRQCIIAKDAMDVANHEHS
ncbi:hypothetical protein E4H12_09055 [Candidatus Thorarchaeota archaeon]|nr:MAG: hypothetical protein E4H12_09055 [Candidatus Thorarchaeota archaeon]